MTITYIHSRTSAADKIDPAPVSLLSAASRRNLSRKDNSAGFTLAELLIAVAVGLVMTAFAIPVLGPALSRMKINSDVATISATISRTRYRAIRDSNILTMAITAPQNTYVVSELDAITGNTTADPVEPLPGEVKLNSGTGTFTYTFCPNGTVYGAGGTCVGNSNLPPTLATTYQNLQTNITVSTVGNVTTTVIH